MNKESKSGINPELERTMRILNDVHTENYHSNKGGIHPEHLQEILTAIGELPFETIKTLVEIQKKNGTMK